MSEPIVLVVSSNHNEARRYCDAISSRGAHVRLVITDSDTATTTSLKGVTGLMLTGGEDIDPQTYGEHRERTANLDINRQRDDLELSFLRNALDLDIPVLGICRGMQLINIAFGGKLVQDLPSHNGERHDGDWIATYHQIYISPGSKLAAIMGSGGFLKVNSIHHQGLKEPQKSPALLASAYSIGDGIIEALESPAHDWVLGVQFRPEREGEVPKSFGRLFQAFVERAEMLQTRMDIHVDPAPSTPE